MFITFEGGEGAGKSTQQKMLMAALQGMGLTPVATREPGGTVLGEKVRKLIMEQKGVNYPRLKHGGLNLTVSRSLHPSIRAGD